ncbi:uncharacterized protein LOC100370233 [Saccoglossus kowalevskii]|uniref:Uncharacterized protein LOC100370233 n=1 Tax=Saccoglossus kowalevskii TaxID=10224 RepID=A0ABM0MRA9_SACKO|nr:PREDICTED: uncharacterized protein LOC100370233 [Saccoglossus kowalevskii]
MVHVAAILIYIAVLETQYSATGQEYDVCATDYDCSNRQGYCHYDALKKAYVCKCYYGYYGRKCENKGTSISEPITNDYKNNDACITDSDCTNRQGYCHYDESNGTYVCRCYYGYYGRKCEYCYWFESSCNDNDDDDVITSIPQTTNDYRICHRNYCGDHGACYYTSEDLWCVCDEGYQGEYCRDRIQIVNIAKLKRDKMATLITVYSLTSVVVLVCVIVILCKVFNTWDSGCRRKSEQTHRDTTFEGVDLSHEPGTWLSNENNLSNASLQRSNHNASDSGDILMQITPGHSSDQLAGQHDSEQTSELHGMQQPTAPFPLAASPNSGYQYDDLPPSYMDVSQATYPEHAPTPERDQHGSMGNTHASESPTAPTMDQPVPDSPPPNYESVIGMRTIDNETDSNLLPTNTDVTNGNYRSTAEHYV